MNFSVDMNIIDNYSFQINGMSDTEYEYLFYKKKKKKKKKKMTHNNHVIIFFIKHQGFSHMVHT